MLAPRQSNEAVRAAFLIDSASAETPPWPAKPSQPLQHHDHLGVFVSRDLIYSHLQKCLQKKDLISGRRLYSLIIKEGLDSTSCFRDHLIRLFALCGSLQEARCIFNSVHKPSIFTWNSIVSAYVSHGQHWKALELYRRMQGESAVADHVTISCALKACGSLGDIDQGRLLHDLIIKSALVLSSIIGNTLLDMYAKCACFEDACNVFDGMQDRNMASWGIIIYRCAQQGYSVAAFQFFEEMQHKSLDPTRVVFLGVLKACSNMMQIRQNRLVHDQIIRSGLEADIAIVSTLIDTYAKCGSLAEATVIFNASSNRDVVSWGAMIAGYTDLGCAELALELYEKMKQANVEPTLVIFLCVLKACGSIPSLEQGKLVHKDIIGRSVESEPAIGSSLIDMYSRCGSLGEAQNVFGNLLDRDSVSWSAIITTCVQHGHGACAFEFFNQMLQEGIQPNQEALLSMLKIPGIEAMGNGRLTHDQIIQNGQDADVILGGALIEMYAKCGDLKEARYAFDNLPNPNELVCGKMIHGYVQQGQDLSALALFDSFQGTSIKSDKVILSCVLKACCGLGALEQGRKLHDLIVRNNVQSDLVLDCALADMYACCGSLSEAGKVFDSCSIRDLVSWGAIIAGCARQGNSMLVNQRLENMLGHGLKPVNMIFTSMLTACCSGGLLEEGQKVFISMIADYAIVPDKEHYSCMVDLLSRAGHLSEAESLLQSIPFTSDIIMWTSLLFGSRTYGDVDLAKRCFKAMRQLDPQDGLAYVLMSNVYTNVSMWEDLDEVKKLRKCAQALKRPGRAWIEANNQVHEFVVGTRISSLSDGMLNKFHKLSRVMKKEGFLHELDLHLDPIRNDSDEFDFCG